ncbi:anthranilate synthase component I family protein [Fructobacillus ficulneus]|uniref:Anthranilate synthase component 1 n=1 Tax=Fructobacillus ficulneus TaxID=157463 RepID=A0A0K8MGE9_9LACO|nr:anthranilate synthase component I family protein [Fructobacillus ficulneus]GAO99532.1 chorismate binding enzyme [Fructobacillus ficulneus]
MNNQQLKQTSHEHPFQLVLVSQPCPVFDDLVILNQEDRIEAKKPGSIMGQMAFTRDGVTTIVVNPRQVLTGRDGQITIRNQDGQIQVIEADPIAYLNDLYQQNRFDRAGQGEDLAFVAGLMGYFSYDFVRYHPDVHLEPVVDDLGLDDFDLLLADTVINYDHDEQKLTLSKLVQADLDEEDLAQVRTDLANQCSEFVQDQVAAFSQNQLTGTTEEAEENQPLLFFNQFTLAEFSNRVSQAQDHIHAGDIFQLILSNPYRAQNQRADLLIQAYRTLSKAGPSPYRFYFRHGDFQSVGSSPETLIKKTGQTLFSYPLAGTRRRGKTREEDDFFAQELANSPKEQAEHNMLVDLGRNDLGRVSEFGTVKVTSLRHLLKFPNVMHLGSTIESQAQAGLTPIDIIAATLPAGTLSGAPKISAMQIINALENRKRGIYGGGIGTVGFDGDLDLCIGIRLAYQKGDQVVVQAGAGIVADSQAAEEYHEFENKSRLMLTLLQKEAGADALVN